MALITCPECGGQVSDAAKACPHCGYQLGGAPTVQRTSEVMRRTTMEEPHNATGLLAAGAVAIVIAAAIFVSLLDSGAMTAIFGAIIPLGIGFGLLNAGLQGKYRMGTCPYCQVKDKVLVNSKTYKCPHCKKVSRVDGDDLVTIE